MGPVYSPTQNRSALLRSCYVEALRVADELAASTVAFPAVSTGAFCWPLDDAADLALRAVVDTATAVREARFVLFDRRALRAFEDAHSRLRAELDG